MALNKDDPLFCFWRFNVLVLSVEKRNREDSVYTGRGAGPESRIVVVVFIVVSIVAVVFIVVVVVVVSL